MEHERDAPRIYAACLASYSAGRLHGRWIDASEGAEEIRAQIAAMLEESPEPGAEEHAIHDHENFGGLRLAEHEDIGLVADAAGLIGEYGEAAWLAIDWLGGLERTEEARQALEEDYLGAFGSLEEWAGSLLEELGELERVPERLRPYLDTERYARDMELSGDIAALRGDEGIHVFWSR